MWSAEQLRARRDRAEARERDAIVVREELTAFIVNPQDLPARKSLGRPKGVKRLAKEHMPLCPRCNSTDVIRRGKPRGLQAYRCRDCRRTFMGRGFKIEPSPFTARLLCYRCGEAGKDFGQSPTSGRIGYCARCRRRFLQGGRTELARYHLLLEQRVRALGLPKYVEEETLQLAFMDVLLGAGYCWTVEIRSRDGFTNARGAYQHRSAAFHFQRIAEGVGYVVDS